MRYRLLIAIAAAGLLAACAGQSAREPVERLDERTGLTVASLAEPLDFVEPGVLKFGKQSTHAYLGPVEWDRMGNLSYGLWLHVAPGADRQVAPVTDAAAVTLTADAGDIVIAAVEAPRVAHEPYKPVFPWGQTAYFSITADVLKLLASSRTLRLRLRGVDGAAVDFEAVSDTHAVLAAFVHSRGLAAE